MSHPNSLTTLVLDARTARIIHFTEQEPASLPQIQGNLTVSVPTPILPPDLKHENSFAFRYEQGEIVKAAVLPKPQPLTAVQANQVSLLKQLDVRLRQAWGMPSPWDKQASSAERAERFAQVQAGYQSKIAALSEQAEIDALAKDIAALDIK